MRTTSTHWLIPLTLLTLAFPTVAEEIPARLAPYFRPPKEFANDFGPYRSPLRFADGRPVRDAADWQKRRQEILKTWTDFLGPWPPLVERPKIEYLKKEHRDNFTQHHLGLETAPGRLTDDAYLLVPDGEGPFPAVVVVFYDGKTGIGLGKPGRDFGYQLARRGFVALSLGSTPYYYYPNKEKVQLQPISFHAYEAANCYNALASLPYVDAKRIGIVGHSYGGKWAMFASCLFDKFACAVWSDPGIVFDEKRSNVNWWEPWYLGYEPGRERKRGMVTADNPRTGPYKRMMETGHDLHELHALMAPRPFLVSGGSEDKPERWKALNHSIAVNKLLGYDNRVAMTNRAGHDPTTESNEVLCLFFEHFLRGGKGSGVKHQGSGVRGQGSEKPKEPQADDVPKAADPRLVVERFAAAPDIVHPVNLTFDGRGRLLVIESHTHFRPPNYQGPPHDRVRVLEDTDGDGKADRVTTFFEGTQKTMDIAAHFDGSVYLATRNEILRLRDTDGDGKADKKEGIAFLDTKGDYPHNGLSGLTFDSKGNLYFGMGENLGADYKLIGSDGTTIAGGGEGGNIFWCTADGKRLRRVATGFWNPFGTCTDVFGRLFAVDNDPDAMPPCRLLHVVEGGDYGYQFRYGRSGRHPFQSWNGQLYGTLPMVCGTGEAPCEVLSYESDGLPREYLGDLLVTAWADHRVERYALKEAGASVTAQRKPFVQGGKDFRPVGLAVAPDGSLFVSDWVLSDYNLHGKGAVWHVRMRSATKPERPKDPRRAVLSLHRPLREAAARQLGADEEAGHRFLRQRCHDKDLRVRAAAVTALIDGDGRAGVLMEVGSLDPMPALRALAVRALVDDGAKVRPASRQVALPPAVRMEAVAGLKGMQDRPQLLQLLTDQDPFLRSAAVQQLGEFPELLDGLDWEKLNDVRQRQGVLLAHRASGRPESVRLVPGFLKDPDAEIRFLAAKWVADEKLTQFRPLLAAAIKDPHLSVRLYYAYATALARIDNQDVSEAKMADYFFARVGDRHSPAAARVAVLRLIPASYKGLKLDVLKDLLHESDADLQREAVRALAEVWDPRRTGVLLEVARDSHRPDDVRAEAVVGVADKAEQHRGDLLVIADGDHAALRDEALRALTGAKLTDDQRDHVGAVARKHAEAGDLVARVLGKPFAKDRPRPDDLDGWLKRLDGPADVAAGRRVFFQPRLANCSRCHRVDGRGQDVGPDLSVIGRTDRRHILESVLQPDNTVAPHYQVWSIVTNDGKALTGMLTRTVLDEYAYVDAQGNPFKLNTRDVAEMQPLPKSIMPTGLADLLTDQELRDLLAYLSSRR